MAPAAGQLPVGSARPMNDVYVTRPREWDVGAGSWHGLDWMHMVTPSQLAAGDALTTPFVAAGWAAEEERNVRPAQFLGLLKCLAALGAESNLRLAEQDVAYLTDNGNEILDCGFAEGIADAAGLERAIDEIPGVVESGLFIGLAHVMVVGEADGSAKLIERGG